MLQDPANHTAVIVDVADDVVQSREAVQFTFFFHFRELMLVELRLAHNTPVVCRGIHRKARSKCAVSPDNQRVAPGAAAPRLDIPAHEFLHLQQSLLLVYDFVALPVLVDNPVNQLIDLGIVGGRQKRTVLVEMFEMRRIDDR